jgi:hypothetical protein
VIALAAENVHERVGLQDVLVPLGASLYVALLGWCLARPLTTDRHRRALWTALVVVLFSTFGWVIHGVRSHVAAVEEWLSLWILGAEALLLGAATVALRKSDASLDRVTGPLNLAALALLVLATGRLVRPQSQEVSLPPGANAQRSDSRRAGMAALPDVYVIIPDSYTGSSILWSEYGFDNSRFEEELRARGFIVPRAARSNYSHTFLSLASMLNGRYLDPEIDQVRPSSNDQSLFDPLVENNVLWRTLHPLGYRFVFFPTYFARTASNQNADLELPSPNETASEFGLVWLRMTPIIPLARSTCRLFNCDLGVLNLTPEPSHLTEWKLARLGELPMAEVATLAIMHLVSPHEPFVSDRDCNVRDTYWPKAYPAEDEPRVKAAYLAQLQCVNKRLLRVVDQLLLRTDGTAIIVLQADHGYGRLGRGPDSYGRATPGQMVERTSIFSAYHLPGDTSGMIYDSITPVNAFRAILTRYFQADLRQIEDRVYFSTFDRPYDLIRLK